MLTIADENGDEAIAFNETFKKIITIAQEVIKINDKIYDNFTKIIVEQPVAIQANNAASSAPRPPNAPPPGANNREPPRPGQPGQPQAPNNQSFNINTNTFIDDE